MRMYMAALALLGLCGPSYAQTSASPQDTPITSCVEAIGKWHNSFDVLVNLTVNTSCYFEGIAKADSFRAKIMMGSGPRPFSGQGYLRDGGLILRIGEKGDEISHFLLRRQPYRLGGTITVKDRGTYPIGLNAVNDFPVKIE